MDQKLGKRMLDIHTRARQNVDMQPLLAEYEEAGVRLMAILPEMSDLQRDAVMDYIGVFGALHWKLLEIALTDG